MSDTVKVKVMRMHSGDAGIHMEGEVYETSPIHAKQLGRLVEIVDTKEGPVAEAKAAQPPANKSETVPANKAETPPANKSRRAGK